MRAFSLSMGLLFISAAGHGQPAPRNALHVEVTTHAGDHARFVAGSGVSFLVSLNRPAYVALIFKNASGKRAQLYPLPNTPPVRQEAGAYLPFAHFSQTLRVSPPFGRETLTVLASDRAFPTLPSDSAQGIREAEWSESRWEKWLRSYPARCECEFAMSQVSFNTFADGMTK